MEIVKWDSDFFGFLVSKIYMSKKCNVQEELRTSYAQNSKLTYIFAKDTLNESILNAYNGIWVDTKVILEKNLIQKTKNTIVLNNIKNYNSKFSKDKIYQLAFLSGEHSRFNIDPNISRDKFELMYKLWVDNSISGTMASEVFLYTEEDKILGFITVSLKKKYGEIGLIAVDMNHQGKNIGSQLMTQVENYLLRMNIDTLRVPTQESNELAVKFYKKNNFNIIDKTLVYHFWNNKRA